MIRIQIPATSANLGSGFDSLGVALTMYNQVWMEVSDETVISSKDSIDVPKDKNNLIYWSAEYLYKECGKTLPGLTIIQENNIIGAVTHVVVDDCTKGYGIFITNMLEEAEN